MSQALSLERVCAVSSTNAACINRPSFAYTVLKALSVWRETMHYVKRFWYFFVWISSGSHLSWTRRLETDTGDISRPLFLISFLQFVDCAVAKQVSSFIRYVSSFQRRFSKALPKFLPYQSSCRWLLTLSVITENDTMSLNGYIVRWYIQTTADQVTSFVSNLR